MHPDTKNVDRKFFNMKGSVLDKIRADFNVDKRDRYQSRISRFVGFPIIYPRCVQLAWSVGEQSPAVWAALIGKIKDGLLSALDIAVSSREEEVRRSESQRHMPGWNFCTYFVLKVSYSRQQHAAHKERPFFVRKASQLLSKVSTWSRMHCSSTSSSKLPL